MSPAVADLGRVRPRLREAAGAAIAPAVAVLPASMGPHAAHAVGAVAGLAVPLSAAVPLALILSMHAAAPVHAAWLVALRAMAVSRPAGLPACRPAGQKRVLRLLAACAHGRPARAAAGGTREQPCAHAGQSCCAAERDVTRRPLPKSRRC